MTPLTHAVVGTVLYQKLRTRRFGRLLAFPLAFFSHYLLDAIPHFEGSGGFSAYREGFAIYFGLGVIGVGIVLLLRRWNREAALIWLLLSLWIGIGNQTNFLWRIPTAIAAVGILAWKRRDIDALGYLIAGMLAVMADFLHAGFGPEAALHHAMHYRVDWGSSLYAFFVGEPVPSDWRVQWHSPYFLSGWGLELLMEGVIFWGALYLFTRERFAWGGKESGVRI